MEWLREREGGVLISVRVQPKASRNRHSIEGEKLKVWITSPPVEGKANEALVEYISKIIGVKKSSVVIEKGEKSREKLLFIKGVDAKLVKERLGC